MPAVGHEINQDLVQCLAPETSEPIRLTKHSITLRKSYHSIDGEFSNSMTKSAELSSAFIGGDTALAVIADAELRRISLRIRSPDICGDRNRCFMYFGVLSDRILDPKTIYTIPMNGSDNKQLAQGCLSTIHALSRIRLSDIPGQ